ncbi:hypothetical protein [Rhodopseudomonas sp. B29]|uniref:hypothetical protein n=1 Tax=Rhodopseudomonas sp. B29 TaxID=95607 RepID=UPI00034CF5DD|nr:hypothetical protein [Rhodopseudomonas sp. B29]
MTGADKIPCRLAALLVLASVTAAPAHAQFAGLGGGAGGEDMMTQMAPMLEMMKAKMGKRRFAMLMQTMGPMMGRMMENGGAEVGGLGGGFGSGFAGNGGGYGGAPAYAPGGYDTGGVSPAGFGGVSPAGFGGGDFMGMMSGQGGSQMMAMIPQLMQLANMGGGHRKHRRRH